MVTEIRIGAKRVDNIAGNLGLGNLDKFGALINNKLSELLRMQLLY
ncbi:MAG: hypothetical protein PUP92_00545 [Rhizonema sp. PD38]|nr:hypothetical protein [Rhizonema sp. PD38]